MGVFLLLKRKRLQPAGRAVARFVGRLENRRRATVLEFESLRFRHLTPLEPAYYAGFAFLVLANSSPWDCTISASFWIVSACSV